MILGLRDLISLITFPLPSFLKKIIYKYIFGYTIEDNVHLGLCSVIVAREVHLSSHVKISPFTIIRCHSLTIGEYSEVSMFNMWYGSDDITLGRFCFIGPWTIFNAERPLTLGNHVGIGPLVTIYTHGAWLPYSEGNTRKFEAVTLEDNVWAPARVAVLPGVTIGKNAVIGSGAVVTKSVPPDSFAAGVPAKVVSDLARFKVKVDEREFERRIIKMINEFSTLLIRSGRQVTSDGKNWVIKEKSLLSWKTTTIMPLQDAGTVTLNQAGEYILLTSGPLPEKLQNARVSWFNFKKRECDVKTDLAKEFRMFVSQSFGEWFRDA